MATLFILSIIVYLFEAAADLPWKSEDRPGFLVFAGCQGVYPIPLFFPLKTGFLLRFQRPFRHSDFLFEAGV
jgi:biotin transporter BioY